MLDKNRILGITGLATRAGRTVSGYEICAKTVSNEKCFIAFVANDVAESAAKSFDRLCEAKGVKVVKIFDRSEIGRSCGKAERAFLCITDEGFAKRITELLD